MKPSFQTNIKPGFQTEDTNICLTLLYAAKIVDNFKEAIGLKIIFVFI